MKRNPHHNILLVDDDPSTLTLFAYYLSNSGHHVQTAYNGNEALELLMRDPKIELVVTDVYMPTMDGITLSNRIHEHYPVLAISGKCSGKELEDIINNSDAYLEKSQAKSGLTRATEKAIERWMYDHDLANKLKAA